jgi:hypothetical protein
VTRSFRTAFFRWSFLPLIPALAFVGAIARAIVTDDPYFALCVGGPALLAAAVFALALRVERFEIDEEGIAVRDPFGLQALVRVPFAQIHISKLKRWWPYRYGHLYLYALREQATKRGPKYRLQILGVLDVRGLHREDIDWLIAHPGLKVKIHAGRALAGGTSADGHNAVPSSGKSDRDTHAER